MAKPKSFDTWPIEKQNEWRRKSNEATDRWVKNNPEKTREKLRRSNRKLTQKRREQRTSLKFFQIAQAISEITNINTEKK